MSRDVPHAVEVQRVQSVTKWWSATGIVDLLECAKKIDCKLAQILWVASVNIICLSIKVRHLCKARMFC